MKTAYLRARQVLESAEEARTQVQRLQNSVAYLESRCTSITSHYGMRTGGSGPDRETLLAQLSDQKQALIRKKGAMQALFRTLEQWIDLLPKPRWRMVLRYHYLEGLDLQDTCTALSQAAGHAFSMAQIYRLHRQALLCADEIWPLNQSSELCSAADVPIRSGIFPGLTAATAPPPAASAAWNGQREG